MLEPSFYLVQQSSIVKLNDGCFCPRRLLCIFLCRLSRIVKLNDGCFCPRRLLYLFLRRLVSESLVKLNVGSFCPPRPLAQVFLTRLVFSTITVINDFYHTPLSSTTVAFSTSISTTVA